MNDNIIIIRKVVKQNVFQHMRLLNDTITFREGYQTNVKINTLAKFYQHQINKSVSSSALLYMYVMRLFEELKKQDCMPKNQKD